MPRLQNNVVNTENLLSFWGSEFWYMPSRGYFRHWVSSGLPWVKQHARVGIFCCCWGRALPWKEVSNRKPVHVFLDSACTFPLWCAVYSNRIAVLSLSCEYNYMLSPVSPFKEYPHMEWSWGLQCLCNMSHFFKETILFT